MLALTCANTGSAGPSEHWRESSARCDSEDDTYFKLFIDLPILCFAATPTTGRAWSKVGLKVDGGEQLSDLVAVQRAAAPGAQIAQPDRSNGCPDEPLDGVIDRREQPAYNMVPALV